MGDQVLNELTKVLPIGETVSGDSLNRLVETVQSMQKNLC